MNTITFADITALANKVGVEPCILHAVKAVESKGAGFTPNGNIVVAFEEHNFFAQLRKVGINPKDQTNPRYADIVSYSTWDRRRHKNAAGEYDQWLRGQEIHKEAALRAASYGLFQIMGFNHAECGFKTVGEFVAEQQKGEVEQLATFATYISNKGYIPLLRQKNWAAFAMRYNGEGYKANKYDLRLQQEYERCKNGRY